MSDMIGIYKITNKTNGKFYIGSSKNISKRFREHKLDLKKNKHKNKKLQNAFNKYGEENFIFEILEECNLENLLVLENKYYQELKPFYNLCPIILSGNKKDGFSNSIYFTKNIVKKIRKLYQEGYSVKNLSVMFKNNTYNIRNIISNTTFYDKSYKYISRKKRLSSSQVNLIKILYLNGYSINSISKYLNCDWNSVNNVAKNKYYKNTLSEVISTDVFYKNPILNKKRSISNEIIKNEIKKLLQQNFKRGDFKKLSLKLNINYSTLLSIKRAILKNEL